MSDLSLVVREAVDATPILDIHTHLFHPSFGMTLWGIDELLTYHYLVAETMRFSDITPEAFFEMPKRMQADKVWDTLFVRNNPVSEATVGVLTVLSSLGLDPNRRDLAEARDYYDHVDPTEHLERVFALSGVRSLVMTNDPLHPVEAPLWETAARDPRFHAALRIDPILNWTPDIAAHLHTKGYSVYDPLDHHGLEEIQRFFADWIKTMSPRYMAVSLPPSFDYPEDSIRARILKEAVLPACRDHGLPFAMMIGVRKQVNPRLVDAGDSVGLSDMGVVERLCEALPDNKFLVTVLARENQHGLCVAARKFANLLPFGCWWFMNNPLLVEETTRMRLEMLGASFVPQHSDARVLDQLIYKWQHSRRDIAAAMTSRYEALERAGRRVEVGEIREDAKRLMHDNAASWIGAPSL